MPDRPNISLAIVVMYARIGHIKQHNIRSYTMPELHVHYSNGHVDNFCGTNIRTISNLRRWAIALIKDQDIDSAILFYTDNDGLAQDEHFGI